MSIFTTRDNPYLLLGWAAAHLGLKTIWPSESIPMGIVSDKGVISAVVVYNAFYDDACHMHIATAHTKRWATRSTLSDVFALPFVKLGLSRVQTYTPVSNVKAQVLALKLGFRIEGVRRGADGKDDEVMFGMLRDECSLLIKDKSKDAQDAALQQEQREAQANGQEIISAGP